MSIVGDGDSIPSLWYIHRAVPEHRPASASIFHKVLGATLLQLWLMHPRAICSSRSRRSKPSNATSATRPRTLDTCLTSPQRMRQVFRCRTGALTYEFDQKAPICHQKAHLGQLLFTHLLSLKSSGVQLPIQREVSAITDTDTDTDRKSRSRDPISSDFAS